MECPVEPDPSQCCNSGCNPCILDVYEKQLKKYNELLYSKIQPKLNCLQALNYVEFRLLEIINHTPYSNIYIFELNSKLDTLGVFYEPAQYLLLKAHNKYDKNEFTRAYTPIPWKGLKSQQFAILINLFPRGDMVEIIRQLKVDDITEWRGPYSDFVFSKQQKAVLMFAQGTGISAFYSIIKSVLNDEECEAVIKLMYSCRELKEVFLRKELYEFLDFWNFKYELFLSQEIELNGNEIHEKHLIKYKETVHLCRLEEVTVTSMLIDENGEEKWSQVLICGSKPYNEMIDKYIKDVSNIKTVLL